MKQYQCCVQPFNAEVVNAPQMLLHVHLYYLVLDRQSIVVLMEVAGRQQMNAQKQILVLMVSLDAIRAYAQNESLIVVLPMAAQKERLTNAKRMGNALRHQTNVLASRQAWPLHHITLLCCKKRLFCHF